MLEGRGAFQRDLDRLERWACANLMTFSKARCKVLHRGRGNPKHKYRVDRKCIESSPEEKDLGVLADKKLNMNWQCVLAAQKANWILGCIKSSMDSRAREEILPLCSGETPPGVLHPALESSEQNTHGPVGAGPEECHKNDQRAGMPFLGGKAERVGAVQPGEEKAPVRPCSSLPVPEGGACKKAGGDLFTRASRDRTRGNGFKLKEIRYKEEILHYEGDEALAQVVHRICGCPLPASVQGQVGWSSEQPVLVEGVLAQGRGVGTR